jgi:exopolyphosphatase / guanosine-5'-triphosphate,3'-diphosphate pyrophosphatase
MGPTENSVRVAVADIGSNSTRLLIADVDDGRVTDELERISTVTRLGAGVDKDGNLSYEGMERVYKTLDEYKQKADDADTERKIAVLTSAVRDSANGEDFAATVKERYGFEPHVLSGDEEAQLTFRGATSDRDPNDSTPTLVFDIGGGSTEMVIGAGTKVSFHVSTQAGVVRQTERHLHTDPPTQPEMDELSDEVRKIMADAVPEAERKAVARAIGVAGTATSLGAIAQQLDPYDPERVHGYQLDADEAGRILTRLAQMPLEERRQVAGLHPDRAPTIIAGVLIFLEVTRLFGLEQVEISEHDILRGAALEFGASAD